MSDTERDGTYDATLDVIRMVGLEPYLDSMIERTMLQTIQRFGDFVVYGNSYFFSRADYYQMWGLLFEFVRDPIYGGQMMFLSFEELPL
jgi:hypothetical protein